MFLLGMTVGPSIRMANRFPVVVEPESVPRIKDLGWSPPTDLEIGHRLVSSTNLSLQKKTLFCGAKIFGYAKAIQLFNP